MTMKSFCKSLIIIGSLIFSATFLQAQNSSGQANNYKLVKDLPYYQTGTADLTPYRQERCKLDVYYNPDCHDLPVVVWFHGGGLTGGSKHIPDGLKNKKIVVVAVNYELSPKAKCKEIIEDAGAAVAWTFAHIAEYGGNPQKIFLSGHSAGGYLSLMVGMDPRYLAPYKLTPSQLAGVFSISGQTITHFTIRKERNIPDKQPLIDEFAPLHHVSTPNLPPIILTTGDREKELLGRYEENAYMMRMMKLNGYPKTILYEIQGYGHDVVAPSIPLLVEFINKSGQNAK